MIFSNLFFPNSAFWSTEWSETDFRYIYLFPCVPSACVLKTLKKMRPHPASGFSAHYRVLIACSMVQRVMWVHWSTKTHAISPSKRCLAVLHKAYLICITLALWCGIAYHINSCNLSHYFGSDLLHYQQSCSSSNATIAHPQLAPLREAAAANKLNMCHWAC